MGVPKVKGLKVGQVIDLIEKKYCSASQACRELGIGHSIFFNNLRIASEEEKNRYARACELRADKLFDEIIAIADYGDEDFIQEEVAENIFVKKVDHEHIQRSKLRIDARKWALAKMMPKKYGDKIDVTSDGDKLPSPTIILNKDE